MLLPPHPLTAFLPPLERMIPNQVACADICFHCACGHVQDSLTHDHSRLRNSCYKTGQMGDKLTFSQPPSSDQAVVTSNTTSSLASLEEEPKMLILFEGYVNPVE